MNKHYRGPTYKSWAAMLTRCRNPNREDWRLYGGRGIKVCKRWLKFKSFLEDMGERPLGRTLDRFPDPDGDYEPGNCRWATPLEQVRSRRKGHFRGEKNNQARLTWKQVKEIRAIWNVADTKKGALIKLLMSKYRVSQGCISKIVYNASWREE